MPFCLLCASIPFEHLPDGPSSYERVSFPWKYIHTFWGAVNGKLMHNYPHKALRFPYHPNIEALRASANHCELCDLILTAVEKAISEYNVATAEQTTKFNRLAAVLTFELWLTKRSDKGDGFWVFSSSGNRAVIHLVAAVGLCVREGDPLASSFIGRPIEDHSESQPSIGRVVDWVKKCNAHQECSASLMHLLPSRVIDVGEATDAACIKLYETDGESGTYITLSYCWGFSRQFTTTRSSIEARKSGIDFNELPKTFQDAIVVARTLGVRYLWIDSLCICQDDLEDWQRESAKMAQVYKNSYLTIAATRSSDNSSGCFGARPPKQYVSIPHTMEGGISGQLLAFLLPVREEAAAEKYIAMKEEPLSQRAWALQERILARRTLHYGKHQMYFECNRGFLGENGLHLTDRYNSLHSSTAKLQSDPSYREGHSQPNPILDQWFALLKAYAPRQLTKASDRLPALSGLAQIYSGKLNDTYVAGLWRNSLLEGLLWRGLGGSRHDLEYLAPSWSWVSFSGIPASRPCGNWNFIAEIIDVHVELKGSNIYGEVTTGWIKIRAPLVRIFLNELSGNETEIRYDRDPKVRTENGDQRGGRSHFDIHPTKLADTAAMIKSFENVEIFALIIAKTFKVEEADEVEYRSLIVGKSEDGSGSMRRLGVLSLANEILGSCTALENVEERPVIKLV